MVLSEIPKSRGLAAASKRGGSNILPRQSILKDLGYLKLDTDLSELVVDLAEKSLKEWKMQATPFIGPKDYTAVMSAFQGIVDVDLKLQGGFEQSERKRLTFRRAQKFYGLNESEKKDEKYEEKDSLLALMEMKGNFLLDPATVDDFRESILGSTPGLTAGAIGDIIVLGDRGCQFVMDPDCVGEVILSCNRVRTVPVTLSKLDLSKISIRPASFKEMVLVEASMRIDAIGSAGLGISRSKLVKAISAGHVHINYKPCKSSSTSLKQGDVVTTMGGCKLEILSLGETRKGKVRAEVRKTS